METSALLELAQLVVDGDLDQVSRRLRSLPAIATMALPIGTKQGQKADTFFAEIRCYMMNQVPVKWTSFARATKSVDRMCSITSILGFETGYSPLSTRPRPVPASA